MILARVISVIAKPAVATGTAAAIAGGGWFAIDRINNQQPTPFQQAQSQGQQLIIAEFGERADRIVAVDPEDVAGGRRTLATVDHAPGWGAFATLSPDGSAIAYTALPADTADPAADAPAVAGVIEDDGDVSLLADDADLLIAPVWAPDSQSIVVRKNTPAENSAGTFELLLLGRDGSRATVTTWATAAVFPIAFAPDGSRIYFATLSSSGTDLYSIAPDGTGEALVAHLSNGIARDWKLSPDGATLAYSVARTGPEPAIVAMTLDVATGTAGEAVVAGRAGRAEYNPEWSPGGELTIGSVDREGGGARAVDADGTARAVTQQADGIDLPLGWSPDGSTLAVRAIEGVTPIDAGQSHVELVDEDGSRERVSDSSDVLIVGWLE
ncbi:MAG: hypothetical protein WEC75_01770 [Dehalococcoidia bacterium]